MQNINKATERTAPDDQKLSIVQHSCRCVKEFDSIVDLVGEDELARLNLLALRQMFVEQCRRLVQV